MNKMNKTLLGIMLVAIIVVVTIGTSFSYMTSGLDGSVKLDVIEVKDGKMIAAYQGNNPVFKSRDYEKQGELIGSKTFSLTGTNNSATDIINYKLSLIVNYNEYEDNEIYFVLGGKTNENGAKTEFADAKTKYYLNKQEGQSVMDLGNGFFSTEAKDSVHTYVIYYYTTNTKANKNFETRILFSAA